MTDGYVIIRAPVAVALEDLGIAPPGTPGHFDIIVLDPPYDDPQVETVVAAAGDVLASDGVLVLEHAKRRAVPEQAGRLTRVRQVTSGDSALSFYSCPP